MSDVQGAAETTKTPAATPPTGGDDWRSGFDEQQRGFIDNKGWAGPADMLE